MRILHFSQTLPGGVASYLEEIAPRQIEVFGEQNIKFVLPEQDRRHVPSIPDACFQGFSDSSRTLRGLYGMARFVREVIRDWQPDVVHLHSSFAGGLGRLPLLGRSRSFAVVYCSHGWSFVGHSSGMKAYGYSLVERLLARATDRIVAVSEFERRVALTYGFRPTKLITIRNGISPHPPATQPSAALDRGKINLLFVGRLDPQKGLDLLLEAMRAVTRPDVHLHVLGSAIVSEGRSLENTANVTFHGWMGRDEVFAFMAGVDAVVMPSRWEAFGLVAVEAMRFGKPVLASVRGALPEIVDHGESGLLFEPTDPFMLADVIDRLERPMLEKMGAIGKARFQAFFTADRVNAELIRLYHEVVAERRTLAGAGKTHASAVSAKAENAMFATTPHR